MTKIRIISICTATLHLVVAIVMVWIVEEKYSTSITLCAILGFMTVISELIEICWVFKGTAKKSDDPNYTWLTRGFLWSVQNFFVGNLGHIVGLVLIVCHVEGAHFLDLMFKEDFKQNWKINKPGLYRSVMFHCVVSVLIFIINTGVIVNISLVLSKDPSENNQDQQPAQDLDDDNDAELGPVTPTHKHLGIASIIMDVILMVDFITLAVVAAKPHSGLVILNILVIVFLCFRIYIVRKCFFTKKNLDEESLVNYRYFCIFHSVAVWIFVWVAILIVVILKHFNENGLFKFVFGLPNPGETQVVFLLILMLAVIGTYSYLIYIYQKCMWLADKIASEKLADMLISAEEDDEGDEMMEKEEANDERQ